MKRFLFILAFLFVWPGIANSTVFYVATTGNDGNSCAQAQSSSTPKQTIAAGISCLASTDTLQIAAGTYAEQINANNIPSGTNFTTGTTKIIGAGISSTNIEPASIAGIYSDAASAYIEFQSMSVKAAAHYGIYLSGTTHHFRFQSMRIHHAGVVNFFVSQSTDTFELFAVELDNAGVPTCIDPLGNGYCHGAYTNSNTGNITMDRVSIHHNNGNGIQLYVSPQNSVLKNSLIYSNVHLGTCQGGGGGCATTGIFVYGTGNKIYNNTIYNNEYVGIWCSSGSGHGVKNNIIYHTAGYHTFADFYDPGSVCTTATNLTADPSFVDAANANFHLQSGSTAKDAGTTLASVTTDYDSVSRPQGAAYDIGAFEYVVSGQSFNAAGKIAVGGKVLVQ